jgi:hypothetical protein
VLGMAVEAASEAAGPGGPVAAVVVPSPRQPSPSGSVDPSGRGPVALDTALVEVMVLGARTAAAAEGMTLAAVAGLVLGRQEAARAELLAWRREHPGHAATPPALGTHSRCARRTGRATR